MHREVGELQSRTTLSSNRLPYLGDSSCNRGGITAPTTNQSVCEGHTPRAPQTGLWWSDYLRNPHQCYTPNTGMCFPANSSKLNPTSAELEEAPQSLGGARTTSGEDPMRRTGAEDHDVSLTKFDARRLPKGYRWTVWEELSGVHDDDDCRC